MLSSLVLDPNTKPSPLQITNGIFNLQFSFNVLVSLSLLILVFLCLCFIKVTITIMKMAIKTQQPGNCG